MTGRNPEDERGLADRVMEWSLRLYPRSFRERDPEGMRYCLSRQLADARERGRWFVFMFSLRTLVHAFVFGLARRVATLDGGGQKGGPAERSTIFDGVAKDFGHALRSLTRNPAFSATVILVFAVGIAANTSVFSLVHSVVFRPLPFPEPHRLVYVGGTSSDEGTEDLPLSYPDFQDLQRLNESFSELAAFWTTPLYVQSADHSGVWNGAYVSSDLTRLLGVDPLYGRSFRRAEEAPGQTEVALIGEGLWEREFGGNPNVLGRTLMLSGRLCTVIGVLPDHFRFPDNAEAWILLKEDQLGSRSHKHLGLLGRLQGGRSIPQAQSDLDRIAGTLAEEHPETNADLRFHTTPIRDKVLGDEQGPIVVFYVISCLTLLIACANIAGLMVARNMARAGELAVRASLGAGRRRLVQFVLFESLLLSLVGGALGVFLGFKGRDLILSFRGSELPSYALPEIQLVSLLPIVGIVILSGLLAGLIPSVVAAGSSIQGMLRGRNDRNGTFGRGTRFNSALVAMEVALALVVLVGTSLMVKSAYRQSRMDAGFQAENVETLRLGIPGTWEGGAEERWQFYRQVLDNLRAHPSVASASLVSQLPSDYQTDSWPIVLPEHERQGRDHLPPYLYRICDEGYFATLGIPLEQGRLFREDEPLSAVVSAEFAKVYWPGQDPLGKEFAFQDMNSSGEWHEVVGVVGDTRNLGYGTSVEPAVYLPLAAAGSPVTRVVARMATGGASPALLRERIREVDPEAQVSDLRPLNEVLFQTNWQVRFYAWGISLFSTIALVLALTGVFTIVDYGVTRRRREFATRVAVGAKSAEIFGMVLCRSVATTGIGIVVGLGLTLSLTQYLASLLFGVAPMDVGMFGTAIAFLLGASLVASLVPARRILTLDPMAVLRDD